MFKIKILSLATHELNNEIASVVAGLDLTARSLNDGDQEKAISFISRSKEKCAAMSSTIKEFIAVTRGRLSDMPAAATLFNPKEFFNEIIGTCVDPSHRSRINEDFQVSEKLIYSDKNMLKLVVLNLISNALKYSDDGSEVEFSVEQSDNELVITVSDHGIGIPNCDKPYLYEAFRRCSNVGTIKGTGVGLSLTKQFVDTLEGTITVESSVDDFTKFTVAVPIA